MYHFEAEIQAGASKEVKEVNCRSASLLVYSTRLNLASGSSNRGGGIQARLDRGPAESRSNAKNAQYYTAICFNVCENSVWGE